MRLGISWIASTFLVILLPIYFPYIYDQAKAKQWKKFALHLAAALAIGTAVFLLIWYGIASAVVPPIRKQPDLQPLDKAVLEGEMTLQLHDPNASAKLGVMLVKFDDARYAMDKKDYDRAISLYEDILGSADQNGNFQTFKSACVYNNLALAYFLKQGDRQFKASTFLFQAMIVDPVPLHTREVIRHNIEELDTYVNGAR